MPLCLLVTSRKDAREASRLEARSEETDGAVRLSAAAASRPASGEWALRAREGRRTESARRMLA